LQSVTFPENLLELREYAFSGCTKLSNLTLPPHLRMIWQHCFKDCSSLTSVIIPASVWDWGGEVFKGCTSLKTVIIEGSCGVRTFVDCPSLAFLCISSVNYSEYHLCDRHNYGRAESCEELAAQINECFEAILDVDNHQYTIRKRGEAVAWEKHTSDCMEFYCDNESGLKTNDLCRGRINQCYEEVCADGECIIEQSESAIEWEHRTDGCTEYYCDNESGYLNKSICHSHDGINMVCIDGECEEYKQIRVMITFEESVLFDEKEVSEVVDFLQVVCGVDSEMVGWDSDEGGNLISVYVVVDDEETANMVADRIEALNCSQ